MSVNYYNQNAQAFFAATKDVDVSSLMARFTPNLPAQAHILDAGCGSGRDSKAFLAMGFAVTSFDASHELAAVAANYIGQPVQVCTFTEFTHAQPFDGIWACASLLHVPASQLPHTFAHLASLLKPQGLFYCSFKYGTHDEVRDGRAFTHCDEERLQRFIAHSGLVLRETWKTTDLRPGRENEYWLNALLIKE
ncbi:class I SAM-dependent methyltransferase [Plesiomonas shigelloides]|uniref:class I SAM-dependent methyltransferase n=1 Tax=Plesiomonas shigelloides TaxID=703 RepID=UPI002119533E|nr:class I SAM-dependent methyltransferase [Plesiomonas shigelloides]MCQ8859429.1 class I SAM-dependent methyltransferase [Plesiomonas shigelloides]